MVRRNIVRFRNISKPRQWVWHTRIILKFDRRLSNTFTETPEKLGRPEHSKNVFRTFEISRDVKKDTLWLSESTHDIPYYPRESMSQSQRNFPIAQSPKKCFCTTKDILLFIPFAGSNPLHISAVDIWEADAVFLLLVGSYFTETVIYFSKCEPYNWQIFYQEDSQGMDISNLSLLLGNNHIMWGGFR